MTDYKKMFLLNGKCALITGGTGGLGDEIARAFLSSGADVAVCGTHPEKAEDLVRYAGALKRKCLSLACNIRSQKEIDGMLDVIEKEFGTLDILVNSAGKNILLPAEDYELDSFADVLDLNVTALHLVTKSVGKRFMLPRRSGKILNLSSVKGFIGTDRDYAAYCASKGAVNMYTKQLACEWGKYNINVNAIAPTFVRTPINSFQLDDEAFYKSLTARIPLGRIGQKKDVAAAALFLCSEASDFVSGQILCVDGGLTARQ